MANPAFPLWFYFGMLGAAGWPRKQGLLRREVVNSVVADTLATQLSDIGRLTGAVDPTLGLQLLNQIVEPPDLSPDGLSALDGMLFRRHVTGWPSFSELASVTPWSVLSDSGFGINLALWFAAELWHGLLQASLVIAEFDYQLAGSRDDGRLWAQHGLNINPERLPESANEYARQCMQLVTDYQSEVGAFEATPQWLVEMRERCKL